MSLLIDVIVIVAFACCLIRGINRGFIKGIIGLAVVIAALIGAVRLSPAIAVKLNDKFIHNAVVSSAKEDIPDVSVDTLVNEMPQAFKNVLNRFGTKTEDVGTLYDNFNDGETEQSKRDKIAELMGAPLAKGISKALAFLLVFVVLYLLLFVISLIICAIAKLPILRGIDKFLGGVSGARSGLLLAWGLSIAISALIPHLSVLYDGIALDNVVDNSKIVKFLGEIDPFNFLK